MGGLKKGKGSGKGAKGGKGKEGKSKEPRKVPYHQEDTQRDILLPLQERVQMVRPYWETLSQDERVKILTVAVADLKDRAAELAEKQRKQAAAEEAMYPGETLAINLEPSINEVLATGIERLHNTHTWKLWQWPPDRKEFLDADSFRQYVEGEHLEDNLRALLPKDEGKPVEKPAEAALRTRMSELLQRVHQNNRQLQEEPYNGKRTRGQRATVDQLGAQMRDTNIELITLMMEALEQEHEFLYHAVLFPVTSCVCELLEEGSRESTCMELCYEDLEKLHPDEVARVCEWLTEKVDGFSSKIKPEAKDVEEEEEEEGIGDVDLFTLSEDHDSLSVNAKWLQHLQERLLGDDGQPRKMKDGEDPFHMGLVLEWVFGTIVSTAEKARDGAKRALGMRAPTAQQAHDQLQSALQEQANWEKRAKDAKELLNRMLKSRREAADLAQKFDVRLTADGVGATAETAGTEVAELPVHVILAMLRREVLLTDAKLHALDYELLTSDRKLRQLRSQLRQGEPEFERLKRELEEVKNQPRGLEGTFRSAAEMERHRAQMADAAIEEQLEVQTAFREHGARLQGIYDKRQRTEMEIARREQEIKQLKGWKQTVQSLIDRFEELTEPPAAAEEGEPPKEGSESAHSLALETAARTATGQDVALTKLRTHFQKDVRRQLYGDDDDRTFFDWIQRELRAVEKTLEDGRAVLQHLEMFLVNVACNDPGAAIGASLVLPLLQERLEAKALEFAAQRAAEAEEAIIKMEEDKAERSKLEREKRLKQKQKAKDKVRSERERLLAEAEAKKEAERAAMEASQQARLEEEEQARKAKLEELERRRKAEEEEMEARRRELLMEEDGYWRRRMAQEAQTQALQEESIVKSGPQAPEEGAAESSTSDATTWKEEDGFRDTARGPRNRSARIFRRGRAEPEVVDAPVASRPEHRLANGRAEEIRPRANGYARDHGQPALENGYSRARPRQPEERTLPVALKPSRSSSSVSDKGSLPSGRASPHIGQPAAAAKPAAAPAAAQKPAAGRGSRASSAEQPVSSPLTAVTAAEAGNQAPVQAQMLAQATAQRKPEAIPEQATPTPASEAQAHSAPQAPDAQEAPQPTPPSAEEEESPPASVTPAPETPAPSTSAGSELAPGTPAQQPPNVLAHAPMPSAADSMPHPAGGGVFFVNPQNVHQAPPVRSAPQRLLPQGGHIAGAGAPPPPTSGFGRPLTIPRRSSVEGTPHQGFQGGLPHGMPNGIHHGMAGHGGPPSQQRRPIIAPPRMIETHPAHYQRAYPRGPPQFASPQSLGPASESAEPPLQSAGPVIPMLVHHGNRQFLPNGQPGGQPGSESPGSGPDMAYAHPPQHFVSQGPSLPTPQTSGPQPMLIFQGRQVSTAPNMIPMGAVPMAAMMPNGIMHSPQGGSPPHPHQQVYPYGTASPQGMLPQTRPSARGPAPQGGIPSFRQPGASTTLRASAPTFVPGGAHATQPLPRRPASEDRRRSEDRVADAGQPGMPRPASSGSVGMKAAQPEADQEMAVASLQLMIEVDERPVRTADEQPSVSDQVPAAAARTRPEAAQLSDPTSAPSSSIAPTPAQQASIASTTSTSSALPGISQMTTQPPQQAGPSSSAASVKIQVVTPPQQAGSATTTSSSAQPVGTHQTEARHLGPGSQRVSQPSTSGPSSVPGRPPSRGASAGPMPTPTPSQPTGPPQPKWSSVAAYDRQTAHSQAESSGMAAFRKDAAGALPRGQSPPAVPRSDGSRPPSRVNSAHEGLSKGTSGPLRTQSSGSQVPGSKSSGNLRTAGDKRKITRVGGVVWEGLQDDLSRLKLVRGLSNEVGRNNCFLNVIIQSLWHLRSFREALLAVQPQALEAKGSPPEDVRVLRALWNIFHAFAQPREVDAAEAVQEGSPSPEQPSNSTAGNEADAKRAKREGQEDAAAAKASSKSWAVSPAELRETLSGVGGAAIRFDLADMHDAAEVLDKIFSSLHRAEAGQLAEGEPDAALPQKVRVPALGAPPSVHTNGHSAPKLGRSSLVQSLFGLEVQVPSPPEDDEEAVAVKKSKGTGGAVVGRWQEQAPRSGREKGSSPKAPKSAPAKKPKDPSVLEMLQFIKLYHLVPAQGLKVAHDYLIGSSFEELLKEADSSEALTQKASGGPQALSPGGAVRTSDIVLLRRPRVFNLAIGWESAQAPAEVINATIAALAPTIDPAGIFRSAPAGPPYTLRCVVCYFGHHYKAYVLSEELDEWLLFDDTTISHIGSWREVTTSLRSSRLQPSLLFYERLG